ncbi:MAG: hypothetical protein ABFC86_00745, partial [Rectinema sp.]
FHILNGIKYLFEDKERLIDSEDITKDEKKQRKQVLYESKGPEFTERSINFVFEVVEQEMAMRGEVYTHDKFFKEMATDNIIRTHILKNIS